MDAYQVPPEWADYGARWGNDGLLYLAEWRRGFTVHELRALFFESQAARSLAQEVKSLTSIVAELQDQLDQAERRAWWYRSQLSLESRAGAMLARLAGLGAAPP